MAPDVWAAYYKSNSTSERVRSLAISNNSQCFVHLSNLFWAEFHGGRFSRVSGSVILEYLVESILQNIFHSQNRAKIPLEFRMRRRSINEQSVDIRVRIADFKHFTRFSIWIWFGPSNSTFRFEIDKKKIPLMLGTDLGKRVGVICILSLHTSHWD